MTKTPVNNLNLNEDQKPRAANQYSMMHGGDNSKGFEFAEYSMKDVNQQKRALIRQAASQGDKRRPAKSPALGKDDLQVRPVALRGHSHLRKSSK